MNMPNNCAIALRVIVMSDLKPVAWQFYQDGKWHTGMEHNNHKQNTIDGGYPVRDLCPVHDLKKIKADAVLGFEIPELDSIGDWRVVDSSLKNYAEKLKRGDV